MRQFLFSLTVVFSFAVQAKEMTECQLTVHSDTNVIVDLVPSAGSGFFTKAAEANPGRSYFVLVMKSTDPETFLSYIQLQSNEAAPTTLDFLIEGYAGPFAAPYLFFQYWAKQPNQDLGSASALSQWNPTSTELVSYNSLSATVAANTNGSKKEFSLHCGPLGWTETRR